VLNFAPEIKNKIMKKLLFMGFILTSTHCFSQGMVKGLLGRLTFGLKAGANYSNYTNADFATDGIVGFHAGALVNFRFSDSWSVQEEFLFSTQGAKMKDDVFGKGNLNVYYLTVPFLIKYKTPFGLYFEAGPQTGLRVKQDLEGATLQNFSKRLDLAAAGGVGYQTKFGLGFGARYIAGLSKVGDFDISNVKTDFRTNVVQASLFYIF